MTLRPDPLWSAIARTLRDDIAVGQYHPGDKLPTEAAFAARFGVNRHTVRRALAALADEGVVHSRQGAGVFVTHAPTDYALGQRVRFHQNLQAAGRVPGRQVQALATRSADRAERTALRLPSAAQVHVCEGVSLADGVPIALFRSVFPAERFPDLCTDLARVPSVTEALRRGGVADYTRASTRLTAQIANALQAGQLRLPPGAPLLHSEAVNIDGAGTPVEYGRTWFASDRVTLTLEA